ncbi:3-demethylubiquinone-9 3-methyltransferase [Alkalispirillum mobile]|uniref:Ubiquinone biosynthesis O-methyltransferase n=1 Tax=Alkalispirillum mobile TaxID=85925 RepID=A0A498C6H2_9GAMM|nr:bifunctional 2-polyprenyl-6-hydroxyphenol methylase/3-demethylubiquinol 3-O-methyltransferase UbiG [Alkalispirillum mobile]RLK48680.1 3-demethylubiquinone-9 3-methyltransferase [Alkalispirillum mobile]
MTESVTNTTRRNVHAHEVAKFDAAASRWWDPGGECKPLHDINPLRLDYVAQCLGGLQGRRILDVGCGGGLLAEGMARRGAEVTGIDMSKPALQVARLHALEMEVKVDYRQITVEELAESDEPRFDVVTCLEMLEHVPDPASVVRACAHLVKPGGQVVFSTLNRNPKSYLFAIVGAEHVLQLLPKGTHDWQHFIRPSELDSWARQADLQLCGLKGLTYNPLTRQYRLTDDTSVNYLAHYQRGPAPAGAGA